MMPLHSTARRGVARRSTLLLALVAAAIMATYWRQVPPLAARRPNVIVLMTDDQRFDALDAMPNVRETAEA